MGLPWPVYLDMVGGSSSPIQGNAMLLYTPEYPGYSSSRTYGEPLPGVLDYALRHPGMFAWRWAKDMAGFGIDLLVALGPIAMGLAIAGLLLREVKERHGEKRKTVIEDSEAEIQIEDLIQEEDMVVTISHSGYIKRTSASDYEAQKRGGKGKRGMQAQEDDWVSQLFIASTHSLPSARANMAAAIGSASSRRISSAPGCGFAPLLSARRCLPAAGSRLRAACMRASMP